MRRTFIILTAFGLALSCNNYDTTKLASDTTTVKHPGDTAESKTDRQQLIEELKRLHIVFASNDKEKIAQLFKFPLSDTTVGIYIEDSTFNAQLQSNSGKISRTMFMRFFPQISGSLQMDELNQLFKTIKLDSLQSLDSLEREVYIKTEPCYKFYGIQVQGDIVTLTTGQGVNSDYKSTTASEDEAPENSSEFCENVLWWVFRFDGKKLHFIKQHGAG